MNLRHLIAGLGLSLFITASLSGQVPVFQVDGNSVLFGTSIDVGDINNDGTLDLLVGHFEERARVYSGVDGSELMEFVMDGSFAVAFAGDVNNDGTLDVIIGHRRGGPTSDGRARVYSGATGALLFNYEAPMNFSDFAYSVSGLGDLNNDGFDDFAIGALRSSVGGVQMSGQVFVYSGFNGGLMFTSSAAANENFGSSIAPAGDIDADGTPDIIIGGGFDFNPVNNNGRVRVISGASGATIHNIGTNTLDGLGAAVGSAGDINQDGRDDFFYTHSDQPTRGLFTVRSGIDGSELFSVTGTQLGVDNTPNARLGARATRAGDMNQDGIEDFAVLAIRVGIYILSGSDGSVIRLIPETSQASPSFTELRGGFDYDGDGFTDIAYGDGGGVQTGIGFGAAAIFSGVFLLDNVYPGTDDDLVLTPRIAAQTDTTSIRTAKALDEVILEVDLPSDLQFSQLLLGAQLFPTSAGMSQISPLPLYFDLSGSPIAILLDSAQNPFGVPYAPAGGFDVTVGVIPPGLEGLSLSVQALCLGGSLTQNGIYAASHGYEIRIQ